MVIGFWNVLLQYYNKIMFSQIGTTLKQGSPYRWIIYYLFINTVLFYTLQ